MAADQVACLSLRRVAPLTAVSRTPSPKRLLG